MIPEHGQHVKCVLRTGALAEGIVEVWSPDEVLLYSLDGESILIITHPREDIMLIKIILGQPEDDRQLVTESEAPPNELEKQFQQVHQAPSSVDDNLRLKKMADLKIMLAEQERKIVAQKMTDHHIGEVRKVTYGYPGPDKKSRPE